MTYTEKNGKLAQTGNMSTDSSVMNNKGCGRNHPFSDLRLHLGICLVEQRKAQSTSVRVAGVLPEIQTRHF